MQQTSLIAFDQLKASGQLGYRQRQVYDGFKYYGAMSNLMLSRKLGIPINQVTPRTNELVKLGMVKAMQRSVCMISRRQAIYWFAC